MLGCCFDIVDMIRHLFVTALIAVVLFIGVVAVVDYYDLSWGWLPGYTPSEPTVEGFVPPAPGTAGPYIEWEHTWEYQEVKFPHTKHNVKLHLSIPKPLYQFYNAMERTPTEDYSIYVTQPGDDAFIETLGVELRGIASEKGFSTTETANFVTSFVQSLAYLLEDEEYPKYPLETLVDKGGDCEDSSILVASILRSLRYDVVLVNFPASGNNAGHMGVGVVGDFTGVYYPYEGKRYFYLETTNEGWKAGSIDDDYKDLEVTIYELVATSVLKLAEYKWVIDGDTLFLETTVKNWGPADADDACVRARLEGGAWQESAPFDLDAGYQMKDVPVEFPEYSQEQEKLDVQICHAGVVVDEYELDLSEDS